MPDCGRIDTRSPCQPRELGVLTENVGKSEQLPGSRQDARCRHISNFYPTSLARKTLYLVLRNISPVIKEPPPFSSRPHSKSKPRVFLVRRPHQSNGSITGPNEEPRDVSLLNKTYACNYQLMHARFIKTTTSTVETARGCRMSANLQSPCQKSAWEAAFQLAVAATHAPCTIVVDVVFVLRMLPLSPLQHADVLSPNPPRPLSLLFSCGPLPLSCLPNRSVNASYLGALLDA